MYMYIHICVFMYMYIPCTYMFATVCKLVNMYIHVCTMFRHVCTNLPIPVQVVRNPDAYEVVFHVTYDPKVGPGRHDIVLRKYVFVCRTYDHDVICENVNNGHTSGGNVVLYQVNFIKVG
jgi:hypothetical protein